MRKPILLLRQGFLTKARRRVDPCESFVWGRRYSKLDNQPFALLVRQVSHRGALSKHRVLSNVALLLCMRVVTS